jgi:Ca-activated chloride channel family protein
MTFEWPLVLLGLLVLPLFAAQYIWVQTLRRRFTLRYPGIELLREAAGSRPGWKRHVPAALFLLAIGAMIVAMARPQATVPSPAATGTVLLVIDASGSMASTDIQPSRIDAAKIAVRDFVKRQPKGVRMGVVAFSAGAFLITPPTEDRKQVVAAVDFLQLGRGTNIGDGLGVALDAILDQPDAASESLSAFSGERQPRPNLQPIANPDQYMIVLLSDGAATTGPDPVSVAQEIADAGIRTYTVGLGAENLQPGFQLGGSGRYMRLDVPMLKAIATETGGEYFPAESASQLHEVYKQLSRRYEIVVQYTEVTFIAVAIGVVLLTSAGALGLAWGNRLP